MKNFTFFLVFLLAALLSFATMAQVPTAGLQLWLRSDAGVDTLNGTVSNWHDQSGNGNDAIQFDINRQPLFVDSVLNHKPVLLFDGLDDKLGTTGSTPMSQFSLFFVVKNNPGGGPYPDHVINFGASGSDWNQEFIVLFRGLNNLPDRIDLSLGPAGSIEAVAPYIAAYSEWRIISIVSSQTILNTSLRWNGSNATMVPQTPDSSYLITLGDSTGSGGGIGGGEGSPNGVVGTAKCDFAEVIVYNTVLTDSQRLAIEQYLSDKYNIAISYSIAQAQTGVLYTVIGGQDSSRLAFVDTSSGVATTIGETGYGPIVSMAVHPSTREIIGLVATGTSNSVLFRINSSGGDAHPLTEITIPNPKGMTFGQDGVLYIGIYNARVYSMNYVTGEVIGNVLTNPPIHIAGLTFNSAGELWACVRPSSGPLDGIYKINLSTGTTTLVGYTGLGGKILDILFYKGKLYGIMDSTGSNTRRLIQINTTTGAGTIIGSTEFSSMQALAAIPDNMTSVREIMTEEQTMKHTLEQNYPNPFNPCTTIQFKIPNSSFVNLKIYDVLGKEVATLVNEEKLAGTYQLSFDASFLSSGIYFYKLLAGNIVETKKMVLVK